MTITSHVGGAAHHHRPERADDLDNILDLPPPDRAGRAAAGGAVGGMVAAGTVIAAAAAGIEGVVAGAMSGAAGAGAGRITVNVLGGRPMCEGLAQSLLGGALAGGITAGMAALVAEEARSVASIFTEAFASGLGGMAGGAVEQIIEEGSINLASLIQTAVLSVVIGVVTGTVQHQVLRRQALDRILTVEDTPVGLMRMRARAEHDNVRLEFVQNGVVREVHNESGSRVYAFLLERGSNGGPGHVIPLCPRTRQPLQTPVCDGLQNMCADRAYATLMNLDRGIGRPPSTAEVLAVRRMGNDLVRPRLENILSEAYPSFRSEEVYGATVWGPNGKQTTVYHLRGRDVISTHYPPGSQGDYVHGSTTSQARQTVNNGTQAVPLTVERRQTIQGVGASTTTFSNPPGPLTPGGASGWDAGHCDAGGPGCVGTNIFPQNPQINRGNLLNGQSTHDLWKGPENDVRQGVQNQQNTHQTVVLQY